MLTIAGGILLAIAGLLVLLYLVGLVASAFTRKDSHEPPKFPLKYTPPDPRRDPPEHGL